MMVPRGLGNRTLIFFLTPNNFSRTLSTPNYSMDSWLLAGAVFVIFFLFLIICLLRNLPKYFGYEEAPSASNSPRHSLGMYSIEQNEKGVAYANSAYIHNDIVFS